jgi:hypothetical protein
MKMVMQHCIQCLQSIVSGTSGGNFGYVRGKGFKTENIVDYICRGRIFSGTEAYPR